MRAAQKLTDEFYEALDKSGSRVPIKAQVEELVKLAMMNVKNLAAEVAKKTHRLKHLDTCRCKRCKEADKIEAAVMKCLEDA